MGELADKIRAKYPDTYNSLSDSDLESKIVAKYPGVYDHMVQSDKPLTMGYTPADFERAKQAAIASQQATTPWEKAKVNISDATRSAIPYIRPAVEGIGAGLGAGLGAGAGAVSGPGAILTGAAGAGLGYAGAKNIMDTLEGDWAKSPTEATTRALHDVALGATFEAGGQVIAPYIAPVLKGTVNAVSVLSRAPMSPVKAASEALDSTGAALSRLKDNIVKKSAARQMEAAVTRKGPVADQAALNQSDYEALQGRMPGFQLTPAQATDDAASLKLQQDLQFKSTDAKTALEAQGMNNRVAIDQHLNNNMPQGTIEDFLSGMKQEADARATSVATQRQGIAGTDKELAGQTLREGAQGVNAAMRRQADSLYGQVPKDMPMDSTPLYDTIKQMGADADLLQSGPHGVSLPKFQRPSATPLDIMGRARTALTPEPSPILGADGQPYNAARMSQDVPENMTFGQVMDFRSQVSTAERAAKASGDYSKAYNLGQLRNGAEQTLSLATENGQGAGVDALREANSFYRDAYVPTVRQGATANVLKTTGTGGNTIDNALVGKQYFQAGDKGIEAANSFNRTFTNNPEAKQALVDYAKNDLLTAATNPNTGDLVGTKVNSWLADHSNALNKLGLQDEFTGVQKALQSQSELNSFAKVIDTTDPHQVIKSLFSGANGKDSIRTMMDLHSVVKDNPSALAGLKRSFSDMMMQETELAKQSMSGDYLVSNAKLQKFWAKYEPAMQFLYKPEELSALKDVRKAFEMENRIQRVISGVSGSQTRDVADVANQGLSKLAQWTWQGRTARILLDWAKVAKSEGATNYLIRAQFDPKVAQELKSILNVGKDGNEAALKKAFNTALGHATTAGMISMKSRDNNAQ